MKAVKPVQSVLFHAYYSHFVTIISIICTIILIISNLEIAIRVHIHSQKLAIWNIHQPVSRTHSSSSSTKVPSPTATIGATAPAG
jgi:hypothetical protein